MRATPSFRRISFATFLLTLTLVTSTAWGRVENFLLLDQNGAAQELYYHKNAPAIVLVSHANGCAAAQDGRRLIDAAQQTFLSRGVVFYYLDPVDSRDTFDGSASAVPVLLDETGTITASLDITQAGEVLLIDPRSWDIVYRGSATGLNAALDSMLAGEAPRESAHRARGCALKPFNRMAGRFRTAARLRRCCRKIARFAIARVASDRGR